MPRGWIHIDPRSVVFVDGNYEGLPELVQQFIEESPLPVRIQNTEPLLHYVILVVDCCSSAVSKAFAHSLKGRKGVWVNNDPPGLRAELEAQNPYMSEGQADANG